MYKKNKLEPKNNIPISKSKSGIRLHSLDILRGVVIFLMIFDHARHYFTPTFYEPTDLLNTYPLMFLSRWITHFCAPIFVFLAGMGVYLSKLSRKELSKFLLLRGLWIIFLELTIINLGFNFYGMYGFLMLQVMWVIGLSMIILSQLIKLNINIVGLLSIIVLIGHNLLDGIDNPVLDLLHTVKRYGPFLSLYSIIPWFAVMSFGYYFGQIYKLPENQRNRICIYTGISFLVIFIALRWSNIYGESVPWSVQEKGSFYTFLSFINLSKYPPSLSYLLMMLSPVFLAIPILEKKREGVAFTILEVLGKTPMFCYIFHIILINIFSVIYNRIIYGELYLDPLIKANPEKFKELSLIPTFVFLFIVTWVVFLVGKKYLIFKNTHKSKYKILNYL